MASRFDDAVIELFQAPLGSFIAERKRLAAALKAAGDTLGATKLGKLARPPISAWVVNQLWWHGRDAFDQLLDTADRLRKGDLAATAAHRAAIAKLRARAAALLVDAGHAATEATLRRVTQTLSALASAGGFDPDPAGTLSADRGPPGFEAVGIALPPIPKAELGGAKAAPAAKTGPAAKAKPPHDELADARRKQAEAAAERRRIEEARAKLKADRHRLEAALRTAKGEVDSKEREVSKLEKQLVDANDSLEQANAVVEDLQAKLDELD